MPPVLGDVDPHDRPPLRVLLRVGAAWRVPLARALLERRLQPVVLTEDETHAPGATLADLVVQEFNAATARQPASAADRGPIPMVAWIHARQDADQAAMRRQALDAGAISLISGTVDPDDVARLCSHLSQAFLRNPAAAGADVQSSPDVPLAQALREASEHSRIGALVLLGLQRLDEVALALGNNLRLPLMRALEQRLQAALQSPRLNNPRSPGPQLARSDDGFAVILPHLASAIDAEAAARELVRVLGEPLALGEHRIVIGGSAGIAVFPHDGDQCAPLIHRATQALHEARRLGQGQCVYYARELNQRSLRRLQIESALRRALSRSDFELRFLPQADLMTGALTGAEALLRWHDPELGTVSPSEFIPVAQETGLINRIGHWVLDETCRWIRQWRDRGLEVPRISVNVAAQQLAQPGFITSVTHLLAEHGLPGGALSLELTEATLMNDIDRVRRQLQALRSAGVRITIDDFGSGYSSLAQLSRLPLDELKIDRVFLAQADGPGAAVASAVVGLGHTLGLRVVAEGVETEAQVDLLRRLGCDEFQGHLLSRPLDAETLSQVFAHARIQHRVVMDSHFKSVAGTAAARMTAAYPTFTSFTAAAD